MESDGPCSSLAATPPLNSPSRSAVLVLCPHTQARVTRLGSMPGWLSRAPMTRCLYSDPQELQKARLIRIGQCPHRRSVRSRVHHYPEPRPDRADGRPRGLHQIEGLEGLRPPLPRIGDESPLTENA